MNVIEKLNNNHLKFSKSDKRILNYVKKNAFAVCQSSISEIAQICNVSHATVTRFSRKLGYDSLRSFKIDLAKELGSEDSQGGLISPSIANSEKCADTVQKLLRMNTSTLKQTASDIDFLTIEKVVNTLIKAKRVFFLGVGNSYFAALDSAYKFVRIGIDARAIGDIHDMQIRACLVDKDDFVIAFSNSGNTKELNKAMHLCKQNGAITCAITSQGESALVSLTDFNLLYAIRESFLESGSINSKLAVFFIIDVLFTEVVKILSDKAIEIKQKTVAAINFINKDK